MQREPESERAMKNKAILATAGFGAVLAAAVVLSLADEAKPMSSPPLALHFVHLYADANGVSHFRDERLMFGAPTAGPGGPEPSLASKLLSNTPGATLLLLKRGAKEDWHKAPRRMYLIVVQGMSEVTAGDGEVRRFGLGSVLLMDDTTGKGHITRAIGNVDHIALTIPAPTE